MIHKALSKEEYIKHLIKIGINNKEAREIAKRINK